MGGYSSDSEDTSVDEEELELEKAALGMLQRESQEKSQGRGEQKKEHIYNVDAIHERLEDISRVDLLPWEETLVCTSSEAAEMPSSSVHDDLEREQSSP